MSKNWKSPTKVKISFYNFFSEFKIHQLEYIIIVLDVTHSPIFVLKLTSVSIKAKSNLPFMKAFASPRLIQLINRLFFIFHVNIAMCKLTSLSILTFSPLDPIIAHFSLEFSPIDIPAIEASLFFGIVCKLSSISHYFILG